MKNKELHIDHVTLYEFQKRMIAETARKNIQGIYFEHAPAFRTIEKLILRFCVVTLF